MVTFRGGFCWADVLCDTTFPRFKDGCVGNAQSDLTMRPLEAGAFFLASLHLTQVPEKRTTQPNTVGAARCRANSPSPSTEFPAHAASNRVAGSMRIACVNACDHLPFALLSDSRPSNGASADSPPTTSSSPYLRAERLSRCHVIRLQCLLHHFALQPIAFVVVFDNDETKNRAQTLAG